MRPSQKATEERKWVVDAVNKYFDIIVEEEEDDEEEEDENEDDDEEINSDINSKDEEIESISDIDYQDSDEEDDESQSTHKEGVTDNVEGTFKSTAKMRGLLSTAMAKMSASKGDLSDTYQMLPDEKQGLLNNLKLKLGSQISLKRRSQDYLNAL